MRTIMVYLSKGGVGKTTISVHYAWYQRKMGQRVLFVDFDMQCNSTKVLTCADTDVYPDYHARSIGTVLDLTHTNFVSKLVATQAGPFDIFSAVEDVTFGPEDGDAILTAIQTLAASDRYDIAIFDMPPSLDQQVVALLQGVDNIIIPSRPDDFSFDQIGIVLQLKKIADQNRKNPLNISGIIITGMMEKPTMQAAERLIRQGYPEHVIKSVINASEPVRVSIDNHIPIFVQNSGWARTKRHEIENAFDEIDRKSV